MPRAKLSNWVFIIMPMKIVWYFFILNILTLNKQKVFQVYWKSINCLSTIIVERVIIRTLSWKDDLWLPLSVYFTFWIVKIIPIAVYSIGQQCSSFIIFVRMFFFSQLQLDQKWTFFKMNYFRLGQVKVKSIGLSESPSFFNAGGHGEALQFNLKFSNTSMFQSRILTQFWCETKG